MFASSHHKYDYKVPLNVKSMTLVLHNLQRLLINAKYFATCAVKIIILNSFSTTMAQKYSKRTCIVQLT
ncbi:hypothetical protein HAZT_HAZT002701 [Hyalella azteca]|uniref:Uncharacterized protein n=1 Tax=Hyalella azteca TaxID=294128 RepID=A0A6A0H6M9_HYAAZ|nr:hypothetical protein HAZT_HAZT002701 [Hyalella azteca]